MSTDTIAAIATALSNSGISIIRISGKDSLDIISRIFKTKSKLEPNKIVYGKIYKDDDILDTVLVSYFKAPKSYTGEDICEINCHGGNEITREILELVLENGARLATPGEFSKRAFINGKMDLAQSEAVINLINAKTKTESRVASKQLEGNLSSKIKELREDNDKKQIEIAQLLGIQQNSYSQIENDSATVDMGYSGRIQGALSEAVGRGVNVFFVHSDSNQYMKESLNHNFEIYSFYGYTPCMSGLIREHILSSYEPSCIGFTSNNGQVIPIFEQSDKDVQDQKVLEQMQRGAVEFANDFCRMMGEYRNQISIKPQEISLPYEGFIRFASEMDLKVFSGSFFEDEVWGGSNRINITNFIIGQHNEYNINNNYPTANIVINNVTGDSTLKRLKIMLRRYPALYKLAKKIYILKLRT